MGLESRIRRWCRHAERQCRTLNSILIHPDDYWRNRELLRFLPIRVIGYSPMEPEMFKSLLGIATDVVKVAAAPIEIAADVTRVVTKPLADVAQEAVKEVKAATQGATRR